METMEFEQIFNPYIKLPYRPEFLIQKLKDSLKNYNFALIRESKDKVNNQKYKNLFVSIFGEEEKEYSFNSQVITARSIENFKKFIYENYKVDDNSIKTKEIIYYLFALEDFRNRLINAIYNFSLCKLNIDNDNYKILLQHFLISKNIQNTFIKNYFDKIYFQNWLEKHKISIKELNNDQLSKDNISINFLKYKYYGPNEIKFKYSLNKRNEATKLVLFSPDFLIDKKLINEYSDKNFQIFNENNIFPGLFIYILKETIKELNNKLNGKQMSEEIVNNIGIHYFSDNTAGVYVNMVNCSQYYEMENLINKLTNVKNDDNLQVVVYSSSTVTESKTIREGDKLTDDQDFYMQYSSHVN